jgi:aerobic-type carbon monoxide dehydrogenase small subunit (CoxS/CutS family)
MALTLRVNGVEHQVEVAPDQRLLYVLRDYIGLTGTKYGCGEGRCGACTVLIDGKVTRSCMTPAASAVGKPITTIEGLEHDGQLHPVQEAFQCGYCTSGAILSAVSLPNKNPHLTDREIIAFLKGNVCRCGTYPRILEAVRAAAGRRGWRMNDDANRELTLENQEQATVARSQIQLARGALEEGKGAESEQLARKEFLSSSNKIWRVMPVYVPPFSRGHSWQSQESRTPKPPQTRLSLLFAKLSIALRTFLPL